MCKYEQPACVYETLNRSSKSVGEKFLLMPRSLQKGSTSVANKLQILKKKHRE